MPSLLHSGIGAAVVAIALAWGVVPGSPARAAGGFDLCVEPVAPACVERPETYAEKASRDACAERVQTFLVSAIRWRQCTYRRLEEVIRQTNTINDRFKCLARPDAARDERCKGVKPPR